MVFTVKQIIFIHQGVSDEADEAIARFGFIVVRLPSFYALGELVRGHPDSLLFLLPDGRLLLHTDYYGANLALLDGFGLETATTDERVGAEYPNDILFNALEFGGKLYGRQDKISRFIAAAYSERVCVRQGYVRCSVLKLGGRAAATSDPGLADALESNGIDVLRLPPGGIFLCGDASGANATPIREGGFIGGCGVMLGDSVCGFFGDITSYQFNAELREFADTHGIKLLSLDAGRLTDFGGAVIVRA